MSIAKKIIFLVVIFFLVIATFQYLSIIPKACETRVLLGSDTTRKCYAIWNPIFWRNVWYFQNYGYEWGFE